MSRRSRREVLRRYYRAQKKESRVAATLQRLRWQTGMTNEELAEWLSPRKRTFVEWLRGLRRSIFR